MLITPMSKFHYEIPANEADFEELVCDLFNAIHDTDTFQLYRRRGDAQFGIDIYSLQLSTVIQCKKKDPGRKVTSIREELIADLETSVAQALRLPFEFKTFILASTTTKFTQVEDSAAELSLRHPFNVKFVAWPQIEKEIHRFDEIRSKHFPHLAQPPKQARVNFDARGSIFTSEPVYVSTPKAPKIVRLPVAGTIGAEPLVKSSIIERFNKLGDERKKRFGKSAYGVMYKNFKSDFKIRKQEWTCIWDWPVATATNIRYYLDDKYGNTIAGRIQRAREKKDYIPGRPQLFAREKASLEMLGIELKSDELKQYMNRLFGVTSHARLSHLQHWLFVLHLENAARQQYADIE